MKSVTTLYLSRAAIIRLADIAAKRGYLQTRGPGAGKDPSISRLATAIAYGDLVAIGPFHEWLVLIRALKKAIEMANLNEDERDALKSLLHQIGQDALEGLYRDIVS